MKKFLTKSNNIERDSVIWNAIGSILMAFQSVFLLIVISHTPGLGLVPAGIYTMGNTLNNLFVGIGKFGIRPFQVSDVKEEYSFRDYKIARIISVLAMGLISVLYTVYSSKTNDYMIEKTLIIIWMCIYKMPDAYEDVYYGEYQRRGRLDIGSKAMSIRLAVTIILWAVLLVTTKKPIVAVSVSTVVTLIIMFWFIDITRDYAAYDSDNEKSSEKKSEKSSVFRLLQATIPLALASFLVLYIGTAPRISIDRVMDDSSQAIYGFIAMPVFVVQLLANFIFNPVLYSLSCQWKENNIKEFKSGAFKQAGAVVVLTVVCLLGAFFLGVPVLSFMYHTDLTPYKNDLMLMMVSSGLLAFVTLLTSLLTIMRMQRFILFGYIVVSLAAFLLTDRAVVNYGIRGAVCFYMLILLLLMVIFMIGFLIKLISTVKTGGEK